MLKIRHLYYFGIYYFYRTYAKKDYQKTENITILVSYIQLLSGYYRWIRSFDDAIHSC